MATSAGFDRTASNVREDPLMRPSLLATVLDNSKTKDKNVAKCSATRHGYILAILIPPYAFPTVYIFFLAYEGKLGIKIVDGQAKKITSSYARTASCCIFRKNAFKIRSRWYLMLLFVVQSIITAAQG